MARIAVDRTHRADCCVPHIHAGQTIHEKRGKLGVFENLPSPSYIGSGPNFTHDMLTGPKVRFPCSGPFYRELADNSREMPWSGRKIAPIKQAIMKEFP